jgi:hypothetical protein
LSDITVKYHPGNSSEAFSHRASGLRTSPGIHPVGIFFFIIILFMGGSIKGQDSLLQQQITVKDTTLSVYQAFRLLSGLTHLNFTYSPDMIDLSKRVSINVEDKSLRSVLKGILLDPSLEFRIIGQQLVIFRPLVVKRSTFSIPQDGDSIAMLEIRGRVLDRNTLQPVPFANICLVGKSIGTVANLEGNFLMKINSRHLQDSLGISCMGYERLIIPITSFIHPGQNYYLKPDIIPIQEVIIRKTNALSLLRAAIENIPHNYPIEPTLLTSFYREIVTKNDRVMAVSEAILQTYKTGYNMSVSGDQIKIVKGRKTIESSSADTLILKLKAGLNTTLLLDVAKNLPEFLIEENFQSYYYKMADIIVSDQNELYVIEFSPRDVVPATLYKGRIFLDLKSLAIAAVEFEVDPTKMETASHMFVLKKPRHVKVKPLKAEYKVTFRNIDGRYYLNLIRCKTSFRIRQKNQLFGSTYSTILEMAVTDIETDNVERFRIKETVRSQDIFMEQISDFQDSFWGEYNFIKPEVPLEKAIKDLGGE